MNKQLTYKAISIVIRLLLLIIENWFNANRWGDKEVELFKDAKTVALQCDTIADGGQE